MSLRGGIADHAVDLVLRQKAQQVDAAPGDLPVGREGDDGDSTVARSRCDGIGCLRKQRADDDLGALREKRTRGGWELSGVEPSSAAIRMMAGLLASNRASSAAFIMLEASARVAAEPLLNGNRTPMRIGTWVALVSPSLR